jgi:hypothetical protein
LDEAVHAAFAGTMKKEDDGPFLIGGPVVWHEDLILVGGAVKSKSAIEETSILAGENGRTEGKEKSEEQKKTRTGREHGNLQATKCITDADRAAKDEMKVQCKRVSERESDAGTS